MKNITTLLAGFAAAMLATTAFAGSIYSYDKSAGNFGNGGSYDNIYARYDGRNGDLTFTFDGAEKGGNMPEGAWVVLNDGGNPKGVKNELAIFYMDFLNDALSVYAYNGENSAASYTVSGAFMGRYDSGLVNSGSTKGISLNVAGINSSPLLTDPEASGAAFDERIGIWFHPVWDFKGNSPKYKNDGSLKNWRVNSQSWYDVGNKATVVPEPASLALVGLGLLGLGAARRRVK